MKFRKKKEKTNKTFNTLYLFIHKHNISVIYRKKIIDNQFNLTLQQIHIIYNYLYIYENIS